MKFMDFKSFEATAKLFINNNMTLNKMAMESHRIFFYPRIQFEIYISYNSIL